MNNDKSYFSLAQIGNLQYPVVSRKKGKARIDECPYCGEEHEHGSGEGKSCHSHCTESHGYFKEIIVKGTVIPFSRGYVIEEY